MKIEADRFYTPDASEMRVLGAVQTLARWRHEGKGPSYSKSGSRVIYHGADVLAWLEARRVETGTPEAA